MGLSQYGKEQALASLLPNGTSRWVALLTTLPTAEDGTGLVEATGSSYARKSYSAWLNTTADGITYRVNNGAIEFAALTGNLSDVEGWAIFDDDGTPTGNLIAYGSIRNSSGVAIVIDFVSGEQPRFLDQELQVGID